ncbi:hypothetical protein DCAR_0729036 [Daucus carota subsp. sativus]|uniref:DCD domain-containing protein n=1 Tax=Daucus carota subsp. sativus TaxID=79200 RepID=A0A161ZLR9_DAUCS|nr:PREDICTED: acyl-CoA-binding domain-containing protein 5-like [Daucus carota subsp. sativus]WOH09578.1 hypothetical protein DCAR_0729036 [Daucus carota subsp. sativus]
MGSFGGEDAAKKSAMWLYPKIMGSNPPERWGHSSCYSNGFIYVYGGCCGGLHFSDVLVLNLDTMAWNNLVTSGTSPGPRDSHSAVLVENRMIVFGGSNGTKKVNSIHILDLGTTEWSQPICQGVAPCPRESHTATLVGGDKLLIFGGSGEGGANYLNDLHVLDLIAMQWTSPEVKGDVPIPRDSHSSVAVGSKLFVYGGDCGDRYQGDVHVLDIDTMTWAKLGVQGPSPGIRAGHTTVNFGTKVYVIGGVGNKHYYNDVWVLDTCSCSWNQLEICGQQPQGRFSHTAIATDTDIAIYGGCGENERPLNEFLILQLGAEHPNGRYNISICKNFGRQFNQDLKMSKEDSHNKQKTTILGANLNFIRNKARETELESKLSLQLNADTLHRKRRKSINSRICEIESEPEEHSLSLSQHSSPSQSDQDQNHVNRATSSVKASQLFPFIKNQSPVLSNTPSDHVPGNRQKSRTMINNPPQDLYVLGERMNHPNPLSFHRGVRNGRHEAPYVAAEVKSSEAPHFQNVIGADVQGKVDGAFDSGYLMTAMVNGRVFRGVLFAQGPEVISRPAATHNQQFLSSPRQIIRPTNSHVSHLSSLFPKHSLQPVSLHSSEPVQNLRQTHMNRPSPVVQSTANRDMNIRSELQGVVLTLGGPGSIGSS